MSYTVYGHPFSSYTWKALIAFHEKELPFTFRLLGDAETFGELTAHWPVGKFPLLLLEDGTSIFEATTIIEYLDLRHYERAPLVPATAIDALDVRFMDRIFDNHVMTPMQAVVQEHIFDAAAPDRMRTDRAGAALDAAYAWIEQRLGSRDWASGTAFSLADCAAAPALFYADWVRPIPESLPALRAYRARLNARPSVARCIEEARPFRALFPLGAPDRD